MSRDIAKASRRRGELELALQAVAVDHGLREIGIDLGALETVARASGAQAAFLGGALAHCVSTPKSPVDLYLLGPGADKTPAVGALEGSALKSTIRVDVVWLNGRDLAFVSDDVGPIPGADLHKLRLLADVERAFPVFGVQAVIELMMSLDPQRLFRWAIGCLVRTARSRLEEARGLVAIDLARHAGLPLSSAALSALSAILWSRGVPVPDPGWATAIAERNDQDDTLVKQADAIALPDHRPEPEDIYQLARRVENLIASAETWGP